MRWWLRDAGQHPVVALGVFDDLSLTVLVAGRCVGDAHLALGVDEGLGAGLDCCTADLLGVLLRRVLVDDGFSHDEVAQGDGGRGEGAVAGRGKTGKAFAFALDRVLVVLVLLAIALGQDLVDAGGVSGADD